MPGDPVLRMAAMRAAKADGQGAQFSQDGNHVDEVEPQAVIENPDGRQAAIFFE